LATTAIASSQLGLGDSGSPVTDRNTPTVVTALGTGNVVSCVAGFYHSLCKKADGSWLASGRGDYGQQEREGGGGWD
jgi:alpha-tubulin suppressor-like RCC1 family protein